MKSSKLIQFISHFSEEEMKQFELYLRSPFFNTNKKLEQLFGIIYNTKHPYTDAALSKEKVYARLYQKANYNDAMMRELMSDLLRAARQFIAHQQLVTDKQQATLLRHTWAYQKGDVNLRLYENNLAGNLLDETPVHDETYYRHNWNYHRNKFELMLEQNMGAEHKLLKDESLYHALHALNHMYLFSFMEISTALRSLGRIYNVPANEQLIGLPAGLIDDYLNQPTLNLYHASYELVKTNDELYFNDLKTQFFARHPEVSRIAKANAAIMLENFCSEMLRKGERRFLDILIEIYREEVEQGLATEHGVMSYIFYQNVASIGAETKYLDWTEEFVEKYRENLPEEYRENAHQYARAHVLFARARYDEALKLALASYNRYFFTIKPFTKNLLCRIYYELNMPQQVADELATYPTMLSDPKMSPTRHDSLKVFSEFLSQLQAVKLTRSGVTLAKLRVDIDNEKLLLHRKWFLDKVGELGG